MCGPNVLSALAAKMLISNYGVKYAPSSLARIRQAYNPLLHYAEECSRQGRTTQPAGEDDGAMWRHLSEDLLPLNVQPTGSTTSRERGKQRLTTTSWHGFGKNLHRRYRAGGGCTARRRRTFGRPVSAGGEKDQLAPCPIQLPRQARPEGCVAAYDYWSMCGPAGTLLRAGSAWAYYEAHNLSGPEAEDTLT